MEHRRSSPALVEALAPSARLYARDASDGLLRWSCGIRGGAVHRVPLLDPLLHRAGPASRTLTIDDPPVASITATV